MATEIEILQQQLMELQKELTRFKTKHPKKPKEKKANGVSYLPVGRTGKALTPISGEEAKMLKIKHLRISADQFRDQAHTYMIKAELKDNEANVLEDKPELDYEEMIIQRKIRDIAEYYEFPPLEDIIRQAIK